MQPIQRSKLVWLQVPANTLAGAEIRFPDIPEIRGKRITGIEAYDDAMLSNTPDQIPAIAAADLPKGTLTLRCDSTRQLEQMPLATLLPTNNGGIWKEPVPFIPNWQASSVTFNATPAATVFAVPLNVFWLD